MRALPIRLRLAGWYFAVLSVTFSVFGLLAFEEMRQSILSAVDDELRGRVAAVEKILNAEAHGGTIDVISTLGQGSTFRVCVPLSARR